jgi:aminoglycoside N3'-acetyltransferase
LMRDYEAYVLMIGVGLETATAIHLPEETVNVDLYVRPAETARLYRCRDRHGTVHHVWARRHWRLDRDFNQFGPPLITQRQLDSGMIENCPYMIVSQRNLLRCVFAALIDNPRATLSLKAQKDASVLSGERPLSP